MSLSSIGVLLMKGLTPPRTASGPAATVRLWQLRHWAAMRWRGWLAVDLSLVSLAWYKQLMSLTTERILEDALTLPDDQRAELAVRLLQSLDREADPDAEEAWAAEIERRCAAL